MCSSVAIQATQISVVAAIADVNLSLSKVTAVATPVPQSTSWQIKVVHMHRRCPIGSQQDTVLGKSDAGISEVNGITKTRRVKREGAVEPATDHVDIRPVWNHRSKNVH